jgi:predicted nucleic acid-binding protein
MAYLADTNVLLRWIEPGTPACEQAREAVKALRASGEAVVIMPQNVVEFWNAATRPRGANGMGLTPAQADAEVRQMEALFPLVPETPAIYPEWRRIVVESGVSGVQVHDARLAAAMLVHSVPRVLTFNGRDFARFSGVTPVYPPRRGGVSPASQARLSARRSSPWPRAKGLEQVTEKKPVGPEQGPVPSTCTRSAGHAWEPAPPMPTS